MRNITQEEAKKYRDITSGQFSNFVLLATELDGVETSVIASLDGKPGDYITTPLAVLVNKEIFKKLKSPGATLIHNHNLILE
ncbi:hypothetical protein JXA85_02975 [Candidatus Woesearchaeota archaeon]|nr:hypothetical protein [Candidatus Woesearchaeota archaeon]